jgi:hypothetical protein
MTKFLPDFDILKDRVNTDAALLHRGRWVTLDFILGIGQQDYLVSIENGRVTTIAARSVQTQSGQFAIRASAECWQRHWQNIPPRDYHDIFAMLAKSLVTIDGRLEPLMQNLQYFKDVIAALRDQKGTQDGGDI